MMDTAQKTKLYDLIATTPTVVWFSFGIGGSLLQIDALILETLDSHQGALAILFPLANVVFWSLLILLLVIRRPPVRKAQGLLPRAAGIVGFLLPLILLALPRAQLTPSMTIVSSATVLVGTVASILIAVWLGRSFSILPQARALVTEGPYSVVRHPLYLAELIVVFGGMWDFEQPWSFLVILAVFGAQLPRMHFEEQVLAEAFPSYCEYASRTPRLLPGVY